MLYIGSLLIYEMAANILSGVTGIRFTLAPQASKTALAIAAPTQIMAGSPPP